MLKESQIEHKVCEYSKEVGWLCYKFSSPSNRGVPDRIFIKNSKLIFIEFKAFGKEPTRLQSFVHKKIRLAGFEVYVVDNFRDGKNIIDNVV